MCACVVLDLLFDRRCDVGVTYGSPTSRFPLSLSNYLFIIDSVSSLVCDYFFPIKVARVVGCICRFRSKKTTNNKKHKIKFKKFKPSLSPLHIGWNEAFEKADRLSVEHLSEVWFDFSSYVIDVEPTVLNIEPLDVCIHSSIPRNGILNLKIQL